jgi:diguanylate cyclase (GGDEF)-like protein
VNPGVFESAEVRSLHARLIELERERSEAQEQARLLEALQSAFAAIAQTRVYDEIVAHLLRAAFDPLGFSRALFFSVDRENGIAARWQIDGSEAVESYDEPADLRSGGAMLAALRGEPGAGVGLASDLSAPFVDVRGWYVLGPLVGAQGTLGLLYADGHASKSPRVWETSAVRALTTIASVAIDNSLRFAKSEALAMRDPLTGLHNRRAFSERLQAEIEASERDLRQMTFVMVDVDDFKRVNDNFGHLGGDAVLRQIADALLRGSRAQDVVARYAGDEFCILLTNVDSELAFTLVARLSAELRAQKLSCSIGAALFPQHGTDAATLAQAADRALYATKAAGKNGFSFA